MECTHHNTFITYMGECERDTPSGVRKPSVATQAPCESRQWPRRHGDGVAAKLMPRLKVLRWSEGRSGRTLKYICVQQTYLGRALCLAPSTPRSTGATFRCGPCTGCALRPAVAARSRPGLGS